MKKTTWEVRLLRSLVAILLVVIIGLGSISIKNIKYAQKLEIVLQETEVASNHYRIEMDEYKQKWLDSSQEAYIYYDQLRQLAARREGIKITGGSSDSY